MSSRRVLLLLETLAQFRDIFQSVLDLFVTTTEKTRCSQDKKWNSNEKKKNKAKKNADYGETMKK
jgi:hypothetical protein